MMPFLPREAGFWSNPVRWRSGATGFDPTRRGARLDGWVCMGVTFPPSSGWHREGDPRPAGGAPPVAVWLAPRTGGGSR